MTGCNILSVLVHRSGYLAARNPSGRRTVARQIGPMFRVHLLTDKTPNPQTPIHVRPLLSEPPEPSGDVGRADLTALSGASQPFEVPFED
jgi:hypothetical protein